MQWRERQWGHNLEAAEALRGSREGGFADWEAAMLFYASMSLVNGWLERQGLDVPTRHYARRRMVEKRLPHLYEDYWRICSMSETARYKNGCDMGYTERQEARDIHERISRAIPWSGPPGEQILRPPGPTS